MLAPVLTVTELSARLRRCLEGSFPLLWVAGEVSNLTRAASGHVYFTLKDAGAQVRCVMFRQRAQQLGWSLANGQQVELNARVSVYEPRGDLQLGVETMRRAGQGRLYEAFARLRQQLEAEGLFTPDRKRDLPAYPTHIGIVSSPQAAALQDVLVTLRRRAPQISVTLFATRVQGTEASAEIVLALATEGAFRPAPDLILLVRGGGSLEDLWPFNEEATARAIVACPIPVVSGVGHETDLTIADLVADLRGATPTAAAELATAVWLNARSHCQQLYARLVRAMERHLALQSQRCDQIAARLLHPATRLAHARERLHFLGTRLMHVMDRRASEMATRLSHLHGRLRRQAPDIDDRRVNLVHWQQRLEQAMHRQLDMARHHLARLENAVTHLAPEHTLARGYAIVRNHQGTIVRSPTQLAPGSDFTVQLAEGSLRAIPSVSLVEPSNPD